MDSLYKRQQFERLLAVGPITVFHYGEAGESWIHVVPSTGSTPRSVRVGQVDIDPLFLDVSDHDLRILLEAAQPPVRVVPWKHVFGLARSEPHVGGGMWEAIYYESLSPEHRDRLTPTNLGVEPGLLPPALAGDWERFAELLPAAGPERLRIAEALLAVALEDERAFGLVRAAALASPDAASLALGDVLVGARVQNWKTELCAELLREVGTRLAHAQIQRVISTAEVPEAVAAAREALLRVASDRGVRIWDVQDEIVPDCGLQLDGSASLVDGGNRYAVVLDDYLMPRLRDAETLEPLDPEELEEDGVLRKWSIMRGQIEGALPTQVLRLEEAMTQQLRWEPRDWKERILDHPLMAHLAQRLIWGIYGRGGRRLQQAFRVGPARELWDVEDEPVEVPRDGLIGVVHRLDLPEELRDGWGVALADYEISTLFAQIDRPIFQPAPGDARAREAQVGIELDTTRAAAALASLYRRGWARSAGRAGPIERTFRARDVKAVAWAHEDDGLTLTTVDFRRYLGHPMTNFELRDVAPIVYSEVMYELELVRAPYDSGAWRPVKPPKTS